MDRTSKQVAAVFILSCCLAFCVNLSIFLVIGRTSPISYNVLGHCKLIVILTFGILYFNDDTNTWRLSGMALAVIGIVSYTHIKIERQQQEQENRNKTSGDPDEELGLKENAEDMEKNVDIELTAKKCGP
eukprot:UN05563